MIRVVLLLCFRFVVSASVPCNLSEEMGGLMCVCTEDYCDSGTPDLPEDGEVLVVVSDQSGKRFDAHYGDILPVDSCIPYECTQLLEKKAAILRIDRQQRNQTILGFGGAFTDSVGYNIRNMSPNLVDRFFESYFSQDGLRYNMGRTTIGQCDYSLNEYYYTTEENDFNMTSWAVRDEDLLYRFPYIKRAMETSQDEFLLTTSLWVIPSWLRKYSDFGAKVIIPETYYGSFSLYIIKYLQAAKDYGISFWSVNYANEPILQAGIFVDGFSKFLTYWPEQNLAKFVLDQFGPDLEKYGFGDSQVLFFDDNVIAMDASRILSFFNVNGSENLVKLVGLHSYKDLYVSPRLVDAFLKDHPNVTVVMTEYCVQRQEELQGAWGNAERYAGIYLEQFDHNYSGWIDWNLVLDTNSGPAFKENTVNSPIIFDAKNNRFLKAPSYYAIGHFSKFMPRGSVKIAVDSVFSTDLKYTAVERPDGLVTVVVLNPTNNKVEVTIQDKKGNVPVVLSPKSIATVVF